MRPRVFIAIVALLVAAWFLQDLAAWARDLLVNLHGPRGGSN
jgi:hypothetical protein